MRWLAYLMVCACVIGLPIWASAQAPQASELRVERNLSPAELEAFKKELQAKNPGSDVMVVGDQTVRGIVVPKAEPIARPKAALFVQNRVQTQMNLEVDTMRDLLSSELDRAGFAVMDQEDVIRQFNKFKQSDDGKDQSVLTESLSGSSALRLAQMIRAEYLIIANINAVDKITRAIKAHGVEQKAEIHKLIVSLKVLEGGEGQSVYGDVVEVQKAVSSVESQQSSDTAYQHGLMASAAKEIAERVSKKVREIQQTKVNSTQLVQLTVQSNVDNVDVALDGAVVGTAPGKFMTAPGIHLMKLSREWMKDWERTVNIIPNQVLTVQMELSDAGLAKYKDLESFKAQIENEHLLTEGKKTMLENSYIQFKGDIDSLTIESPAKDATPNVINNIINQ